MDLRSMLRSWIILLSLPPSCSQIEQITISFDGGSTKMNFAEAALLIQGSTCVYSKKVLYMCLCVCVCVCALAGSFSELLWDTRVHTLSPLPSSPSFCRWSICML